MRQAKGSTDAVPQASSRRAVLRGGGALALAAIGAPAVRGGALAKEPAHAGSTATAPAAESRYVPRPGATLYDLTVAATTLDPDGQKPMAGVTVNGTLPGPEIRVREGEQFRALVQNGLDGRPTSVHWHGLLVPAGMDGVPEISNAPIAPGQMYVYEFPVRQSGTYWYHSHVGFQEQVGMYGAFVIEAADDPLNADHDAVVLLGDWLHRSPEQVFAELRGETGAAGDASATKVAATKDATKKDAAAKGMQDMAAMPGMAAPQATAGAPDMAGTRDMPGMAPAASPATAAAGGGMGGMKMGGMPMGGKADLSDVAYPTFLLNGKAPNAPWTLAARPGERIRLRIVNAAASTYFKVALDGHRLEVTHADGMAVVPVVADHLLMGMAEGYDVVVELEKSGSYTLHAIAQDGSGQAIGVLHTPDVEPAPDRTIPALAGKPLEYAQLRALAPTTLPDGPVRTYRLPLQGDMKRYVWMIDGQAWPKADPLPIKPGERVRLELVNQTMMWHPMHLHGHFFRLLNDAGDLCPLKHTVNVAPGETVRIEFGADNPGRWFFHCHNVYHLEAGMAREFVYVR